jgi:hypothetical protein
MTKVISLYPKKRTSFMGAILQLGKKRTPSPDIMQLATNEEASQTLQGVLRQMRTHLLFDWEFFSNELEYE